MTAAGYCLNSRQLCAYFHIWNIMKPGARGCLLCWGRWFDHLLLVEMSRAVFHVHFIAAGRFFE